jgi:hypothetical protein
MWSHTYKAINYETCSKLKSYVSTLPKLLIVKLVKSEKICSHTSKIILTFETYQNWKLCEHTSKAINCETCQNWKVVWAQF